MNCPKCSAAIPNESDRFCSSCGARVERPAAASVTNLTVKQDVSNASAGAEVTGVEVQQIHGDVRIEAGQVVLQSSEAGNLRLIESISTEVRAGTAAGLEGSKVPAQLTEANGKLDALLKLLRDEERRGKRAEGVEAGGAQVSHVDLLLKKATLLKIQADQMMLDHVERNRPASSGGELDMNALFAGFDTAAHDEKLREARSLLEHARSLDPANTEVLLHLAELLTQITEDDPSDERRVLYEVQSLLRNPKDDTERFRLAQATFLLATSHEPVHVDSLKDARDMFDRLGRSDWTRHCDDLLRSLGAAAPGQPAGTTGQPPVSSPPQFQPAGNWNVRVMDAIGSVMTLSLAPNGMFQATQTVPVTGMTLQASGQWAFNPMNSLLQLQGTIGGWQPFMLGIFIQGWQGDAFYGVGTDGIAYALSQA